MNTGITSPESYTITLTFDEFDRLSEKFDGLNVPKFLPTLEQIDMWRKNPEKWLMFAVNCHDTYGKPQSKEEQYRKKTLMSFIEDHLVLVD